jgi:hypothetical protein
VMVSFAAVGICPAVTAAPARARAVLCCSHPGFPHHEEGHAAARIRLLVLPADGRHPGVLLRVCGAHPVLATADSHFYHRCQQGLCYGHTLRCNSPLWLCWRYRLIEPAGTHQQAAPTGCCPESLRCLLCIAQDVALEGVSSKVSLQGHARSHVLIDCNTIVQASGWLMETLLTMTLVFVVFAATDTNRAKIATHLPVGSWLSFRDLPVRGLTVV